MSLEGSAHTGAHTHTHRRTKDSRGQSVRVTQHTKLRPSSTRIVWLGGIVFYSVLQRCRHPGRRWKHCSCLSFTLRPHRILTFLILTPFLGSNFFFLLLFWCFSQDNVITAFPISAVLIWFWEICKHIQLILLQIHKSYLDLAFCPP